MNDFKLENNVPNVYVDESRDFQLLCRALDIYLKGCIDRASNIIYQLDLDKCSEQLLYAIANMQGFTTNIYIPPNVLRNICKVFPYCIKRKGTEDAIRTAAYAVFSTDRLIYQVSVRVYNQEGEDIPTIEITCDAENDYLPYLKEFLRFITPAGWRLSYRLLKEVNKNPATNIITSSRVWNYSGIMSRVMGNETPLDFKLDPNGTEPNTKIGFYSRIGMAKIYKYVEDERSTLYGNEVKLLSANTIPVFIGSTNTTIEGGQPYNESN